MTESFARGLFVTAYAELLKLGVNLDNVCDKRIVDIYLINRKGIYPVTFLEALARLDEKTHSDLGPDSYVKTWID